jgi:hypothetical protein
MLVGAILLGELATGSVPQAAPVHLPVAGLTVVLLVLAALPILLEKWRLCLCALLTWIVFEDLVRKFAGNNLGVYLVKDVIFTIVVLGLLFDRDARGAWRNAVGRTRLWLYLVIAWAIIMAVPTVSEDWRLPLVALRLDFAYLPLTAAGYVIAGKNTKLAGWFVGLALIGAVAAGLGIVQAVIGPEFLAPSVDTPGLTNLELYRSGPGGPVYRPTGTFVDPGRFALMTLVALAVALCAFLLTRRSLKTVAVFCTLVASGAVWISGGRAGILAGAGLIVAAAVGHGFADRRPALTRSLATAGAGLGAVALVALLLPNLFASQVSFYGYTLDPRSAGNEWTSRWDSYSSDTWRGLQLGGLIGQGTGQESLGRQYLSGELDSAGVYQVEGGYASIATEWGLIGLCLWMAWTVAWARRQWHCVKGARGTPLAAAGLVLFAWMLFFLFIGFFAGLQGFQNYFANTYFWLLSGVIFGLPRTAGAERAYCGSLHTA